MVVLKNAGLWIGGYDFAGVTNEVNLSAGAVAQEADVIANEWKDYEPGLLFSSMSLQGLFRSTDAKQFSSIAQEEMMLVVPAGQAPGDVGYVVPFIASGHELAGSIGELLAFSYATQGKGEMFRAQVFDIRDNVQSETVSRRLQLGAIPAGQTLHVWAHIARLGGTLEIGLESAADATTATIAPHASRMAISATGMYPLSIDGPITDEHWQLRYTTSAAAPDFDIAAASFFADQMAPAVPITPITPPTPATHTLLGGLSMDAVPEASELTIIPTGAGVYTIPTFVDRHVLFARDSSQPDLTSIVDLADATMQNQIVVWTKYGSTVNVGGTDYNVWVSNQVLTFPSQRMIQTS